MPQLDIYTFPTQIYFFAIFFFLCLIYTTKFVTILFFQSELIEKEEINVNTDSIIFKLKRKIGTIFSLTNILFYHNNYSL